MTDIREAPSGPLAGSPRSADQHVAVVPSLGEANEATVVQYFLRLGAGAGVDPSTSGAASFMRWMIATTKPGVTVTVGPLDPTVRLSMSDALERTGAGTRYLTVKAWAEGGRDDESTGPRAPRGAPSASSVPEEFATEADAKAALGADSRVDLLHVAISGGRPSSSDLTPWLGLLGRGATVVFTDATNGVSEELDRITEEVVPDHFRTVRIPLGVDGEALVVQEPIDGSSRSVDLLENVPGAVGSMLTLFHEHADAHGSTGEALALSPEAEALVARLLERQHTERAAFLEALRTYQDLTLRLSDELSATRQGLAAQSESARMEREALVTEFLDRVDLLAAKVSTGASRHRAELEEKERLLEDAENRVLVYAGLAASAESVVADLRRSSSWRVTAPLRLFSGLVRRRGAIDPGGR